MDIPPALPDLDVPGVPVMDHNEIIERFSSGEIDILYRVWIANRKKMTGWKSYRKTCQKISCPWPWNMPHARVEWKCIQEQNAKLRGCE